MLDILEHRVVFQLHTAFPSPFPQVSV